MCIQFEPLVQDLKLLSRIVSFSHQLNNSKSFNVCIKFHRFTSTYVPSSRFHTTKTRLVFKKDLHPSKAELIPRDRHFGQLEVKKKDTFIEVIDAFNANARDANKRGHIEFIYSALRYMEEYGVQDDIEVYKKLMDVFPKGKMIPKSLISAEFFHFPRHQECALIVLDRMERNGLCPDKEMKEIVLATFGISSNVYLKVATMLYWMPKLKNLNPYLMPKPLPQDARELARLALKKMCVDRRTKIEEYDAKHLADSADKTWIMSAQSPTQQKLIKEHSEEKALYIEGPTLVWLSKLSMTYFVLKADPKNYPDLEIDNDDVSNLSLHMFGEPKPKELALAPSSVHEQEDGIIMALCCTGTSSKDSLLSWIRFLKETNPKLDSIPVLFKIRSSPTSLIAINIDKRNIEDNVDNPAHDPKS